MEMTVRALDAISVPAFIVGRDHKVVAWNTACALLTGLRAEDVVGTDRQWVPFYKYQRPLLADLVLDMATDQLASHYQQHGKGQFAFDAVKAEGWYDNLNGQRRYLVFEARPLVAMGEVAGALEMLQDITEYKQAGEHLKLAAQVFENTGEGIMVTDAFNRIISINRAFRDITGYGDEVVGEDPRVLSSRRHSHEFYKDMWKELRQHGDWQGEIWNSRKDGSEYLVRMHISVTGAEDGSPNYVAVFSDITKHKEAEERITFLAHHDFLTSLPNRILLEDRLSQLVAQQGRGGEGFGVAFLDLDHFKLINDALGHDVGDKLLKEVAGRLLSCVRATDTVSRQGGDEFVLLLTGMDSPLDLAAVVAKLVNRLSEPYAIDGHSLAVTPSIGLALFPADGRTPAELIKNADTAMYHAKSSGRNTFKFFTQDLNARVFERLMIEGNLRSAIPDQLYVEFQPQLCLQTQSAIGAEALVRWRHPSLGLISPDKFIPVAESSGLIRDLGRWVLEQSCALIRRTGTHIAVNLSPLQLADRNIVATIAAAAEGVGEGRLTVEITEGALIKDFASAKAALHELRNLGILIALDDFGTGYASLSYLRQLPIDYIKIDRSFIIDPDAKPLVRGILGLADHLGISTIAEGVETPEQMAFLERHGCGAIQGYYYSRPMGEERFIDFMVTNGRPAMTAQPLPALGLDDGLLSWSFTFATGIDEIDLQHKEFIRLINLLHAARDKEDLIPRVIADLIAYAGYHFATEAKLMAQYRVGGAAAHHKEHTAFSRDLKVYASPAKGETAAMLAERLALFLGNWLSDHILSTDKELGRQLRAAGY